MNKEFRQSIAVLKQTTEDFASGHTTAVAHASARSAAICAAVKAMARSFGVQLGPLSIDSLGELSVVAVRAGAAGLPGCGQFGGPFAARLNTANPRTGVQYGSAQLHSQSGWCKINHFDAEKLVLEYAKTQS